MSTTPSGTTSPSASTTTAPAAAAPRRTDWRWITLAIAILAGILGFVGGRAYERSTRYDVYWLLGATISADIDGPYFDVVYPGGPASLAGLQHGDHLGAIDGRPVTTAAQARRIIGQHVPGDVVQINIRRDGYVDLVPVTLGFLVVVRPEPVDPTVIVWPSEPPPPPFQGTWQEGKLGVYYRLIESGDPFGVDHGALIITVWPGGPADQAGLVAGDIVLEVDGDDITSYRTLENALEQFSPGDRVSLRVRTTEGQTRTVRVTLSG